MLLTTLAVLALNPSMNVSFAQDQRDFAAAVLAGAACQHIVNGVSMNTVTESAAQVLSMQGINVAIIREEDVKQRAWQIYEHIKTRGCRP
jgi:hypothetical protein